MKCPYLVGFTKSDVSELSEKFDLPRSNYSLDVDIIAVTFI